MRSTLCVLAVLGWLAHPTALRANATQQSPPELTAPVNDFANVINGDAEDRLSTLIRALQAASGDVIVVATIKTFQPAADIRVYANEMFENHGKGIGQKGKDNGILVLLAVDDREVWAEVGYDLESIITDGFAGETSRQTMVPYFKQGDYGGGLLAGVTVFAQRIARARNVSLDGVSLEPPARSAPIIRFAPIPTLFMMFVILHLIRSFVRGATRGGRRRRRWGSGVGPFGSGYGGWSGGSSGWSSGGGSFGGGFSGFGGGRSGGGGGGASW
jgi:uncharacterized protein